MAKIKETVKAKKIKAVKEDLIAKVNVKLEEDSTQRVFIRPKYNPLRKN